MESTHQITITNEEIQAIIPHRYPFLLIDKIVEFVDNERLVAIKNVTANEQFFQGHFPGRPVMPGVLILEAMAQAAAVLAKRSSKGVPREKTIFLAKADNCKWKRQVVPGDILSINAVFKKTRGLFWLLDAVTTVGGEVAATASITAAVLD